MTTLPLVSIGAANYNNSKYLIETLDSIKNQSYTNIELIIVDDCSTDNSVEMINNWLKSYDKPYKFIIHDRNLGVGATCNDLISNAKGMFFSLIATDDLILPYKIEEQVNFFEGLDDNYGVVYGDIAEIDEDGNEISTSKFEFDKNNDSNWSLPSGNVYHNLLESYVFYLQSALIKTKYIKNYNFYFKKKILSEDWYLELFLATKCDFFGVDRVYAKYRIHNASITRKMWTDNKIWKVDLRHAEMFGDVLKFKENSEEEKSLIINKIYNHLLQSSYHEKSNYWDVLNAYFSIFIKLPLKLKLKLLYDIHKINFYKLRSNP